MDADTYGVVCDMDDELRKIRVQLEVLNSYMSDLVEAIKLKD